MNFVSVANYNRINEWPLQFLRTGYYRRSYGYLVNRTVDGFWWSASARSVINGYHLGTWISNAYAQNITARGDGLALRCVSAKK